MLRKNQQNAVNITLNNNFESGIHFHATGTGKSWVALQLILAFNEKYKHTNIFWICERKSILIEQFSSKTLKERGYEDVFKKFHILNYSDHKQQDWFNSVNTSRFWGKSTLTIINRSFLTSNDKFKKININIDLIIHDECHTINNQSTRDYYSYMLQKYPNVKVLGFSATPNTNFEPFQKILSNYSIYNAYIDDVIVQPTIHWFKSDENMNQDLIIQNVKILIDKMPYKKVIIWCGMIESCINYAKLWNKYFHDYLICIDTSVEINDFHSFEEFENKNEKALLFCAGKHREGSDIKNLDCAVFLDFVQNRYCKTFVQCIGRVLRKDKNNIKKSGLIIDIKAKSSTKIIDKMSEYLEIPKDIFPWSYNYQIGTHQKIMIHTLKLLKNDNIKRKIEICNRDESDYTVNDLYKSMIRTLPNEQIYKDRLKHEINMIESKKLIGYIMRALEILKMTKHIPHVTRGSCGSSLVCYLVGISHVDPIKYNIKFSRFLNKYRNNLPDIDFDFPYNMRDEVFLKLQMKWPGKIARISNHVYYHEKSAKREGLRSIGIRGFISKYDINDVISNLNKQQKKDLDTNVNKLDGTFRCFSLHCGGIVYYPEGVPEELKLKQIHKESNKNGLCQIVLNKHDISDNNQFKIDILSSRALAQLYQSIGFKNINFEKHCEDIKTKQLLMNGDNIGLTFAESPLIRKSFMKIKPKTVDEIAICLSIIRPAAKDARNFEEVEDLQDKFVFDDDAIDIISKALKCDEDLADKYRRGFAKGDETTIAEVAIELSMHSDKKKNEVLNKLKNLRKYSFCKSHAYSYAQLVWQLAYVKAHSPKDFWKATLNHCESSYKKWVHYYEARCIGVDYNQILLNKDDISVFSKNRMKKFYTLSTTEQLKQFGYWDMKTDDFFPGCYFFKNDSNYVIKAIIASSRMISRGKKRILNMFVGYSKGKYCEITINYPKNFNGQIIGVKVSAKCTDEIQQCYEAYNYSFF
jgi:superfamily II DNA or RNA helicase